MVSQAVNSVRRKANSISCMSPSPDIPRADLVAVCQLRAVVVLFCGEALAPRGEQTLIHSLPSEPLCERVTQGKEGCERTHVI